MAADRSETRNQLARRTGVDAFTRIGGISDSTYESITERFPEFREYVAEAMRERLESIGMRRDGIWKRDEHGRISRGTGFELTGWELYEMGLGERVGR